MGFPRSLRNVISFTIPDGYKAVGIQNLNMNIDNETGTFAVQASVEGNTLSILVKKLYKQVTVKKEDWPKLLEMLDAAFNFSQKKILLKKINSSERQQFQRLPDNDCFLYQSLFQGLVADTFTRTR